MRIDEILDFFETASKAELILTIIVLAVVLMTIIEIFMIGNTVRKTYKMQKLEFKIIQKEFARINPNQYVTNYSTPNSNDNNAENNKMDTI